MRMPVFLLIIFKVLALAFVFSALQEQSAYADRGLNETPRSSWGFECEKGLAPGTYDGKRACVKCGGRNQPACEPRRVGKQCTASYTQKNSDGICEPRGGNNQPKLKGIGYDLRFHLHPDVDAALDLGGAAVSMALKSGEIWVFRHDGQCDLKLETSVYLEKTRLKPRQSLQIVLSGRAIQYATQIRWTLSKAQETAVAVRDLARDEPMAYEE